MSTLREGPRIQTRLSMKDYIRFQRYVNEKRLSIGQLARDAICFYLDHLDKGVFDEHETELKTQMAAMEKRVVDLLETTNIDVGVMLSLVYSRMNKDTRDLSLKNAHQKATQRLRAKLYSASQDQSKSA